MASWTEARLQDPGYRRYLLGSLTLDWLCEQLGPYLKDVIHQLHSDLIARTPPHPGHTKPVCDHPMTYKEVKKCALPSCGQSVVYLDSCHVGGSVIRSWTSSDILLWETQPWSLALLFMLGQDPRQNLGPANTDISGTLNLLDHCVRFTVDKNVVKRIRDRRNALIHGANFQLEEAEVNGLIDDVDALLKDPAVAPHVNMGFIDKCIKDVRTVKLHTTSKDEVESIKNLLKTVAGKEQQVRVKGGKIKFDTNSKGNTIVLGEGATGKVFRGKRGNMPVALKRMSSAACNKYMWREIDIFNKIEPDRNKNIVGCYDEHYDEIHEDWYLVMELCACSLKDMIEDTDLWQSLQMQQTINIYNILNQTLEGLFALHQRKIVHRDMKPSNILLKFQHNEIIVKICDFGISREIDHEYTGSTVLSVATRGWASPEIANLDKTILDERTDIFSAGLVIYYALHYHKPTPDESQEDGRKYLFGTSSEQAEKNIKEGNIGIRDLHLQDTPITEQHLVKKMTDLNPDERPCVKYCLRHPLFMDARRQIRLIEEFSNALEIETPTNTIAIAKINKCSEQNWSLLLGPNLKKDAENIHKKKNNRLCQYLFLIRIMRNKFTHGKKDKDEFPDLHQELWGTGDGFDETIFLEYFTNVSRFPRLITNVWDVAQHHLANELKNYVHCIPCDMSYCNLSKTTPAAASTSASSIATAKPLP